MNTECVNPSTTHISEETTENILKLINNEDAKVAAVVAQCIPQISVLVDEGYKTLQNGGKIVYCGCGTSGRLAVADAAECPPTYGVPLGTVNAVIAGGVGAMINASEGCEDSEERGIQAFLDANCKAGDLVIGISASGKAPFVRAFMKEAKKAGCKVAALVNNENTPMEAIADMAVTPLTGPEVIKGSTRMKAGTSQKMILNMFSTAVFIKMGYVYQNYMVNMVVSNSKLKGRALSMLMDITELDEKDAEQLLAENEWSVQKAIKSFLKKKV